MQPTAILERTSHRAWPLPAGPWVLRQRWLNLLFVHWPVPAATVRPLVPPALTIQEFGGTSWVGIVPFVIEGLSWRFMPDLPYFSSFPELNLRLYVEAEGKPGVWFVSLDADNLAAVLGARATFSLPYFRAAIDVARDASGVRFKAVRRRHRSVAFDVRYLPRGKAVESAPGSLEHFLTERYCLYAPRGSGLRRLDIQHPPWKLQPADADIVTNTVASAQGVHVDTTAPPLLHFSARQDVLAWWPERVGAGRD
jgi:uncharacterized protein YqjF (DUF2071 family)